MHTCSFKDVSIASAASTAHTHPSRKGAALRAASTKGRAALRAARPFVDSFLDRCVWAGEAADAMETSISMHETCACMHITRNSFGHDIIWV